MKHVNQASLSPAHCFSGSLCAILQKVFGAIKCLDPLVQLIVMFRCH